MPNPKITIFVGSDSDLPKFEKAMELAENFDIDCTIKVASAHRSPSFLRQELAKAEKNGSEVIIAGAGWAAHLAGVIASHTLLPVIGVPIDSSPLQGLDSLLSSVMMPSGIPVATMAIGEGGAKNAVILAAQILSLKYPRIKKHLLTYRRGLANSIKLMNSKVKCKK
jgi:phosphoribosylaminoimidazole carboxylase PurE protein